jgi:hypothetical protein
MHISTNDLHCCKPARLAGRQQTAPPQQRRSKDATSHPMMMITSPGPAQTPHTPTQPTAAATTQPKPRSNPHYGTEFLYWGVRKSHFLGNTNIF